MKRLNGQEKEKLVDFRKITSIIQKNFIVLSRDRTRLVALSMFPMIMILIFGFTSGNSPKYIPTAAVMYDNSPLAETVLQAFGGSQILSITNMVSTEGEGKQLLDTGKVKVLIEIPPGMQQSIDSGVPAVITVMVDESDSSVAATARGAISAISASLSRQLGVGKVVSFQQSVSAASQQLQSDIAATAGFGSQFSLVISNTGSAASSISTVANSLSAGATALENSLTYPVLNSFGSNNSRTALVEPPGYSTTKALIAAQRGQAALLQAAAAKVRAAGSYASIGKQMVDTAADYETYQSTVTKPTNAISQFASYDANTLVTPLTYAEKPAYGTGRRVIDFLIPAIIALTIFQGAVMGMGRAIAGEKREGSLTRVFLTPTSNVTIILGTATFYVLFELFRSTAMMLLAVNIFKINIEGSLLALGIIMIIYAAVSTAIGLFLSSLVKSEQQYMGVSMLVGMPTIFLSGAFLPVQAMPQALQKIAAFLPITYGADALRGIMIKGLPLVAVIKDLLVLLLFLVVVMGAVFVTFKREIE